MKVSLARESETAGAGRWMRWSLPGVLLTTALAYLPSLGGGFLNWDDPWLILENPILRQRGALLSIWADFTLATRVALGAEYLPMRDTSYWFDWWLFGPSPLGMRLVNLGIYLLAIAVTHRWLRAVGGDALSATLASATFALHPVHVESAAWVAGRKDVLAILFVSLAVDAYVRRSRATHFLVPLWFLLAMLSKSMCVTLPLLLPCIDYWQRRRPDYLAIALGTLACLSLMPLHWYVGKSVAMVQPVIGGSVVAALATMAPVWWRYVELLVFPIRSSVIYEVPTAQHWNWVATLSYLAAAGSIALATWRCRVAKEPRWLVLLALFCVPLLPVSQVLVPLQNRMADRYLAWSTLAASFALMWAVEQHRRWGWGALACVGVWTSLTAQRAALFGNGALLFADATAKTTLSGVAPYQLGCALEEQGDLADARLAYEEVWRRTQGKEDSSRRATNNLARVDARLGDLEGARAVLERGLQFFPNDRTMRENLRKVQAQ
jgi:hypothetical protein